MKQFFQTILFLMILPSWLFSGESDEPFLGFFIRKGDGYDFNNPDWKVMKIKDYYGYLQPSGHIDINEDGSISMKYSDPKIPTLYVELLEVDIDKLKSFSESAKGKMMAIKVGNNLIWEGILREVIESGDFKIKLDTEETLERWKESLETLKAGEANQTLEVTDLADARPEPQL